MKNLAESLRSVAPKGAVSPTPEKLQTPRVEDFLSAMEGLDAGAVPNTPSGTRNASTVPRIEARGLNGGGNEPAARSGPTVVMPQHGFDLGTAEAAHASLASPRIGAAAKTVPEAGTDKHALSLPSDLSRPETGERASTPAAKPSAKPMVDADPRTSESDASAEVTPLAAVFAGLGPVPIGDNPKVAADRAATPTGDSLAPAEPETRLNAPPAPGDFGEIPGFAWGLVPAMPSATTQTAPTQTPPTPTPPAPEAAAADALAVRTTDSAANPMASAKEGEGPPPASSSASGQAGLDVPAPAALRPSPVDLAAAPSTNPGRADNDVGQNRPRAEIATAPAPTGAVSAGPALAVAPPPASGTAPVRTSRTGGAVHTNQTAADRPADATVASRQDDTRTAPMIPWTTARTARQPTQHSGSPPGSQIRLDNHMARAQASAYGQPRPAPEVTRISDAVVAAGLRFPDGPSLDEASLATAAHVPISGAAHTQAQPPAPDAANAARPVAVQLASATAQHQADGTIEVNLSPQELGRVRMVIHHDGTIMNVAIHADRPDTLDLMRRHTDVLAQEFRAQGYSGTAFAFSGGDSGAAGGQNRPPVPDAPPRSASSAVAVDTPQVRATPGMRSTAEGLDLRL